MLLNLRIASISHRTVDMPSLVPLIPDSEQAAVLQARVTADGTSAVILVTCNRVECIWLGESNAPEHTFVQAMRARAAASDRSTDASDDVIADEAAVLSEGVIVQYRGEEALTHLLRVSAGLESQLQGDSDILGQVRLAWSTARNNGFTSTALDRVFERIVNATRHVRLHAGFDDASRTIGRAAADVLGERIAVPWEDASVLVLGSGSAATSALDALHQYHPASLAVSSRTDARAADVARKRSGVQCVPWHLRERAIAEADVVVFALRTEQPVVGTHNVATLAGERPRLALWADLGMPPNVHASVQHQALEILSLGTLMTWRELEAACRDRAEAALARECAMLTQYFERRATGRMTPRFTAAVSV